MKKINKTLAVLLAAIMTFSVFTALPITANAAVSDSESVGAYVSGNFEYQILSDGTARITQYTGSETDIIIPSELDGYKVEILYSKVFSNCPNITSITIPDSVTVIYSDAFNGCTGLLNLYVDSNSESFLSKDGILYDKPGSSLVKYPQGRADKSFTVPDFVTTVSKYAFYDCNLIEEVIIGDNVTTLQDFAFYNANALKNISIGKGIKCIDWYTFGYCSALESIFIPSNITYLDDRAFTGCTKLAEINVASNNAEYSSNDGVLYDKSGEKLLEYPMGKTDKSFTVPNGVLIIEEYSFYSAEHLEELNLDGTVTDIGNSAFSGCENLKSLRIGSSVQRIESYAFNDCISLTSVTIPDSVTYMGSYAFRICSGLREITIGKGITEISEGAFWFCTGLTDFTVPDHITKICDSAFKYCSKLENITIPDSVTGIGAEAFLDCSSLVSVTIPESVTEIGAAAFNNCKNLTEITIPASVVSIGNNAFYNCPKLTVYGCKGTTAQAYAKNNGLQFLTVPKERYKLTDSDTGITALGTISEDITLSIEKFDDSDNKNILSEYRISLLTPDNTVVNPKGGVEVSIPCVEQDCKVLSPDSNGTYHFVKSEYLDGCYTFSTDSLSTYALSKALSVEETISLDGMVSSSDAQHISWLSSDTDVARVSSDGMLTAINPGVVTITATDATRKFRAKETFTVVGERYTLPDYELTALDKSEIEYTSSGVYKQIPCEKLNGIYFLKGNKLNFYSLSGKNIRLIHTFDGCTNAYSTDDRLYVIYRNKVTVYDLLNRNVLSEITFADYTGNAVGADSQGRIYVAATNSNDYSDNKLFLYSASGELLSQADSKETVYNFNGFDSTNGNFYMESYYDWIYWGYSHPGKAVTMGNVTDNVIMNAETYNSVIISGMLKYDLDCIEYACQNYYLNHQDNAALLGNKYLVTTSVTYGRVQVIDSNSEDLKNCMSLERSAKEYEVENDWYDTSSIGVRAVYNENHNSIIVYENGKTLNEYNPETGEKLASFNTQHYVFNLMTMGDSLVIIEKEEGEYYIEIVNLSDPESIKIIGENSEMKAGESQQLTLETGIKFDMLFNWSSSDKSVVSVTDSGKAVAWKKGRAVITCTSFDGKYSAEYTITVTPSGIETPDKPVAALNGTVSDNVSDNNYSTWSSVVNSYLYENDDNTLTRVEYMGEKGVVVENYSPTCELIDSRSIDAELPYFGGFFSGKDANYLVFGQKNEDESNACEIIRVVKYSKSWEKLGQCSYKGANTYVPFDAGSLRMTETDGMLYIYTCHTMYESSDGYHHQANMTFVINEKTMTVSQTYYDVMNISQTGYVSHSFNQFVKTDGKYVYRVDHGDSYPRAVSITRCEVNGSIEKVGYTFALPIKGYSGYNATGVSVGGFELSGDNCLIVGNTVDQSSAETYDAYGQRNIFLTVTDKNLLDTKRIMLTDYTEDDNITPRTPQLVKLSDEHFLIMWEEYNEKNGEVKVKMVTADGDGTLTSDIVTKSVRLSDCQPVVTTDGLVKWYSANGNEVTIYAVNPYELTLFGDVNGDGTLSIVDATLIQAYLVRIAQFDDSQKAVGDVNGDGTININDVTLLQKYIAGIYSHSDSRA